MGSMSLTHWLLLALVAVVLFGPGRLGDVGKGLGEGFRNFKKGLAGKDDEAAPTNKGGSGDAT